MMMRWLLNIALFSSFLVALPALAQQVSPRVKFTINDAWRYASGPMDGAETGNYDDSGWTSVTLPHTWNADDAFDKVEGYRRGIGWYRKQLSLDESLQGKRIYLYFEGANQVAEVYVNGQHAGQHIGGYTAFVFDITDLVSFDTPNLIAVQVDNSPNDDIPPLDADFTFYGGIYRDGWLLATEPVHIDVLDHASPGIFIDTPEVSAEQAAVRVRGAVVNETEEATTVEVIHRILDAENHEVAALRTSVNMEAGVRQTFEQTSEAIVQPRIWSPDDPYLYRVVTEVYDGDTLVDQLNNPLGFRWFSADAQEGFFLNGKAMPLYGTNRHQDFPGYGNAVPNELARRDVQLVKENGFNFLRLAHYPQDPVVLDEADRQGLVVWEETPVVNTITMSEAFAANAELWVREMIRQHYNHPSVAMWGYMNEILLRQPNPLPDGYLDAVVALGKRLDAVVREEDPSRLTVTAISEGEVDNGTGFQDIPDILGMNLYFGWYYHDFETLGTFLDDLHARNPDRPLFISEYGAGSDERVHAFETAESFDFTSEYAQWFHTESFRQILDRPYLIGSAVWNQFDFGSAGRQDTKNAINQKGLYFFDRTPKDIAYYYEAQLKAAPVLHIADEWNQRAGSNPEARTQPVWIYSNLDEVELIVNGVSIGIEQPTNATATWDVSFRDGANHLLARGERAGQMIVDETEIWYADRTDFFSDPASPNTVMAVNVGAHEQFVDEAGIVWEADQPYQYGRWGYEGGEAVRTHHRIYGTNDDPLFQTARQGMIRYQFNVPDGAYTVRLLFSENQHDDAGQRLFGVEIGSGEAMNPIFNDLDLAEQYGRYGAVERTAQVWASGGAGISIRFKGESEPVLSGILLRHN
ncbi:MAG TPA: glycoside hydrolase family 2 TIM barrel-domain containing protein [Rhodothermales bacterium]|nr:glycoside hydrolase family 2 TIM barrel-domain containing protein [Rhodothermales bacterium]